MQTRIAREKGEEPVQTHTSDTDPQQDTKWQMAMPSSASDSSTAHLSKMTRSQVDEAGSCPALCMMLSRSFRSTATLCATRLLASRPVEASSPGLATLNLIVGNSCTPNSVF